MSTDKQQKSSRGEVPHGCLLTRSRQASHLHKEAELAPNPALSLPGLTVGDKNDSSFYNSGTHCHPWGTQDTCDKPALTVTSFKSSCQAVQRLQDSGFGFLQRVRSLSLHTDDTKIKKVH